MPMLIQYNTISKQYNINANANKIKYNTIPTS